MVVCGADPNDWKLAAIAPDCEVLEASTCTALVLGYRDSVSIQTLTLQEDESLADAITTAMTTGNNTGPSKLVKQTKVPNWGTGMKYKAYKKSIEVREQNNKDMPEPARYQ